MSIEVMNAPTDEELVPRLVELDEQAVELLVSRYWSRAYRVALQLTSDPALAEDLAQETFLRVLKSARSFDTRRRFRPWFFQILRNQAANHLRGQQRRAQREERVARREAFRDQRAERTDEAEAVRERVRGLNPEKREVLTLHYLEGFSLKEVADLLRLPLGTVKSRRHRGLEELRTSLQPSYSLSGAVLMALLAQDWQPVTPGPPATIELTTGALTDAPVTEPAPPDIDAMLQAVRGVSYARPLGFVAALLMMAGAVTMTAVLLADPQAPRPPDVAQGDERVEGEPVGQDDDLAPVPRPARGPAARPKAGTSPDDSDRDVAPRMGFVAGRVVRSGGEPLPGVEVRDGPDGPATTTDAQGAFRLAVRSKRPVLHLVDPSGRYQRPRVLQNRPVPLAEDLELVMFPLALRGVVVDPDGSPAPRGVVCSGSYRFGSTPVNAKGEFRLENLKPGPVTVRAWAPGFAETVARTKLPRGSLRLELGPGGTVQGRVVNGAGLPIAEAWIVRARSHPMGFRTGEAERAVRDWETWKRNQSESLAPGVGGLLAVRSDGQGRFSLERIPVGRSRLLAWAPGHSPTMLDVTFTEPGTREVELKLTGGTASLEGTVTGAGGKPISGARVHVSDSSGRSHYGRTDAKGRYTLADLPPGRAEVDVSFRDEPIRTADLGRRDPLDALRKAQHTTLSADQTKTLDISLAPGRVVVRGRVSLGSRAYTGRFSVALSDSGVTRYHNLEAKDGAFELRSDPGTFEVLVWIGEWDSFSTPSLQVAEAAHSPWNLKLPEKSATVDCQVFDAATGEPIHSPWLVLLEETREEQLPGRVVVVPRLSRGYMPGGRSGFAFTKMPAGRFRLQAQAVGYGAVSTTLVTRNGETTRVQVRLRRGTSIRGRLRLPPERRARAKLVLRRVDTRETIGEGHSNRRPIAPDGTFVLKDVAPGSYVLYAFIPGHAPARQRVEVGPAGARGIVLAPTVGAGLEVRVRDGQGRPVPRARLTLVHPDGEVLGEVIHSLTPSWRNPISNAEGVVLLEQLIPGTYRVVVRQGARITQNTIILEDSGVTRWTATLGE